MQKLQLPGKETAYIAYHLFPATAPADPPRMVVFLNGMMGPQMTWHPVIKAYKSSSEVSTSYAIHVSADLRSLVHSASLPTTDTLSSMA